MSQAYAMPLPPRPANEELGAAYDEAVSRQLEIRECSDGRLVIWEEAKREIIASQAMFWLLLLCGVIPGLIYLAMTAADKNGHLTTYEVRRDGSVKRKVKRNHRQRTRS